MGLAYLSGQPPYQIATRAVFVARSGSCMGPDWDADPPSVLILLRRAVQILCSECRSTIHDSSLLRESLFLTKFCVTGVWIERPALEPQLRILVLHLVSRMPAGGGCMAGD